MGSKALAGIYGLTVYEDNLQDMHDNLTRFLHVVRF
jgi:prephenate dehydratase